MTNPNIEGTHHKQLHEVKPTMMFTVVLTQFVGTFTVHYPSYSAYIQYHTSHRTTKPPHLVTPAH